MGYQETLATMRDELKKSDSELASPEQAGAAMSAEAAATILKDATSPEARDLIAKISGASVRLAQVAGLLNIPPDTPTGELRWKVGSAVGLLEEQVRLEQILGPSDAFKAAVAAADIEKGTKLGDFLRRRMKEQDVSVSALASAGGIDESTMQAILGGAIIRPPDRRLRGFARVLGVSFASLVALLPADQQKQETSIWPYDMATSARGKDLVL